jgi:Predicted tRNA(5-methylaminomethyl-2-thiouridylate) methyltransferase, contains the PP-loop ATPase domain
MGVAGMKHVVLFSGGVASSYMAFLLKKDENIENKDIVLLHTPTLSECEDSEKFRLKVARYLKLPMTVWGRGEDVWDCIERNNAIPGQFLPFCTMQLKQEMKEQYYRYLKECDEDWIEYVGYGPDEWRRIQKSIVRNETKGRKVRFPLAESKITNNKCKDIIQKEWKIELPSAYKVLKHNNCIPCFKGGKSHWYEVWKNYPEEYQKASQKEEKIGYTVFKDYSLKELEVEFLNSKEWEDMQISLWDYLPCECCA